MGLEKISELKKKLGYTNSELASLSGVPKGTLDKILSGITKDPKLETLKSLARVLGCTLDDFDDNNLNKKTNTTEKEKVLLDAYNQLNDLGKDEAIKRVSELSEIPKYCNVVELPSKKDAKEDRSYLEPFAAHNDYADNEEELELIKEDEKLFDTFD